MNAICPTCGQAYPVDTIWAFMGAFYCSEQCAKTGMKNHQADT